LVQLRPPEVTRLTVTLTEHNSPVNAAAWASNSQRFATADNSGQIFIWELPLQNNGQPILEWNARVAVRSLVFSPDDMILAAVLGGNGRFYNASNGEALNATLPLHSFSGNMAWSPNSKMIAGVGADGLVRIWQVLERP
jgi:WD40 repeat protein